MSRPRELRCWVKKTGSGLYLLQKFSTLAALCMRSSTRFKTHDAFSSLFWCFTFEFHLSWLIFLINTTLQSCIRNHNPESQHGRFCSKRSITFFGAGGKKCGSPCLHICLETKHWSPSYGEFQSWALVITTENTQTKRKEDRLRES